MHQKKILFLFFSSFLLACALLFSDNTHADRPLSTLFDNLVCEPPCWNHITPGITTREQLLDTLGKIPVDKSEIIESAGRGKAFVYYERYYPVSDLTRDQVIFKLVDSIVVELEFESFLTNMSLSYMLNQFGEPDYAIQEMYGEIGWMTILFYPSRGVEIWCMPRSFLIIGSIGCNLESDVRVYFYVPRNYETRLIEKYGSPENAEHAKRFFCPWVGIDASYLSIDWVPIHFPDEYPAVSPEEIASRCPTGK